MRIAVYPGSFAPVTYGHLDVAGRAAAVFDRVVFAVLVNARKGTPEFPVEERVIVIREAIDQDVSEAGEMSSVKLLGGSQSE